MKLPDILLPLSNECIFALFDILENDDGTRSKKPALTKNSQGRAVRYTHNDTSTLCTLAQAKQRMCEESQVIAVSLSAASALLGRTLVVVDVDGYKVSDPIKLANIVKDANTYIDHGPGGTHSYHIWYSYNVPPKTLNIASYVDDVRGFVTVTGQVFKDLPVEEIEVDHAQVNVKRESQLKLADENGRLSIAYCYNAQTPIEDVLFAANFRLVGNRWASPTGNTSAGGKVFASTNNPYNLFYTHQQTDLDWIPQKDGRRLAVDAFALATQYFYNGDAAAAGRDLADKVWALDPKSGERLQKTVAGYNAGIAYIEDTREEVEATNPRGKAIYEYSEFSWPPGKLGEVARWVYTQMYDPQKEIAIITAYLLVVNFCGRKHSFNGVDPALVITMTAITGAGKDTYAKLINKIVPELLTTLQNPNVNSFLPMPRTFGVLTLAKEYAKRLSGVQVITEAGVVSKSTAGDGAGLKQVLLSSSSKAAYDPLVFPAGADNFPTIYGVPVTQFKETTLETYQHELADNHYIVSGEAGRTLFVRVDSSKTEENDFFGNIVIPPDILEIFEGFVRQAVAGENFSHQVKGGGKKMPGVSTLPVPAGSKIFYEPSAEVKQHYKKLKVERTKFRQSQKKNEATLEWSHKARYEQLLSKVALIHAMVDHVASNKSAVVEMHHINAAAQFIEEVRRTERDNAMLFDDSLKQLAYAVWVNLMDYFAQKETTPYTSSIPRSATTIDKRKWFARGVFSRTHVISRLPGRQAYRQLTKVIYSTGRYRDNHHIFDAVFNEGIDQGYWEIVKDAKCAIPYYILMTKIKKAKNH